MRPAKDTIAAIATPPGRGGVGIVRVSGSDAGRIASAIVRDRPPPRQARLRDFCDAAGSVIDQGLVLWMPGPDSFTGEDVFELHGHGGMIVTDLVLQRVLELGARAAEPGEFLQRAFLNDQLDLAQAEAIADLIDSGSAEAARAATRALRGELSAAVSQLQQALTELRIYTEAAIDFPEEEIDFLADAELHQRLHALRQQVTGLLAMTRQGVLLQAGMTVVIAGAPNAGKSSLLNRLAGYAAAIVTAIPGTTRDVLRERLSLDGLPLHVIDTAGLRDTGDAVEREGVRRAQAEMAQADRVLLVVDGHSGELPRCNWPTGIPVTLVINKTDLGPPVAVEPAVAVDTTIMISAETGAGLDELRDHLKTCMGYAGGESNAIMARRRHIDAIQRAHTHIESGAEQLATAAAGELLAEELRLAQRSLGEITGEFSSDDLLGEIFSSFCIGK